MYDIKYILLVFLNTHKSKYRCVVESSWAASAKLFEPIDQSVVHWGKKGVATQFQLEPKGKIHYLIHADKMDLNQLFHYI